MLKRYTLKRGALATGSNIDPAVLNNRLYLDELNGRLYYRVQVLGVAAAYFIGVTNQLLTTASRPPVITDLTSLDSATAVPSARALRTVNSIATQAATEASAAGLSAGAAATSATTALNRANESLDLASQALTAANNALTTAQGAAGFNPASWPTSFTGDLTGGGTLTPSGLNATLVTTGVVAGAYGGSTTIAAFTVDAKGRIVSASNLAIRQGSTAQTGVVQLSDSLSSTSTVLAATANSVRQAYSLAAAAQPGDPDLTAIAGLTGPAGLLRKTATDTWSLDTNVYLTSNQNITFSGDVSGSGSTSVNLTLSNSGVTAGTYGSSTLVPVIQVDAKGRITNVSTATVAGGGFLVTSGEFIGSGEPSAPLTLATTGVAAGTYRRVTVNTKGLITGGSNPTTLSEYGITDAQPLDADLTAIGALTGASGLLRKIAANTWSLDTTNYLTSNQTITLTGDVSGSGATSISAALVNSGVTAGTYGGSTQTPVITVDAKGRVTDVSLAAVVPQTRSITVGTGLLGGGSLASNLSIAPDIATQAEAETGISNAKLMTPLRVAQAIQVRAGSGGSGASVPPGTVIWFAGTSAPEGYVKANGAALSRTTFANLFAAIGTTFGVGDGSTTFNVPDLRGEFIRGWADGRAVDTGRTFGSAQASANLSHSHTASQDSHSHAITVSSGGAHTHTASDSGHSHTASSNSTGAHTHTGAEHQHNLRLRGISISYTVGSQVVDIVNLDTNTNTGKFTELEGARATTSNGAHSHTVTVSSGTASISVNSTNSAHSHTASSDSQQPNITVASNGTTEARPRNIALLACIKF